MRVVIFDDGKYAVRRGGWLNRYEYAVPDADEKDGYCWYGHRGIGRAKLGTLADINARLVDIQKKRKVPFDYGTPVD